jgi:hypothetical protein
MVTKVAVWRLFYGFPGLSIQFWHVASSAVASLDDVVLNLNAVYILTFRRNMLSSHSVYTALQPIKESPSSAPSEPQISFSLLFAIHDLPVILILHHVP